MEKKTPLLNKSLQTNYINWAAIVMWECIESETAENWGLEVSLQPWGYKHKGTGQFRAILTTLRQKINQKEDF